MKKILCICMCVWFVFGFSACFSAGAEIVLVTDASGIEDSARNEGLWEGIRLYAGVHDKTCNFILPSGPGEENYLNAAEKAVDEGASLVVLSGEEFAFAAETLAGTYPDVSFVLMDAQESETDADNWFGVQLLEEEAGYLAGYMAVLNGQNSFGFLGVRQSESDRGYGFGFVQGVAAAAEEENEQVSLRYLYVDEAIDETLAQQTAGTWFGEGVELIFVGEETALSTGVFNAAEEAGGLCIATQADQGDVSPSVQTSAVKYWQTAMGIALELFYAEDSIGSQTLGVEQGAVGLSMESSRFEKADMQDYDVLLTAFRTGQISLQQAGEELSFEQVLVLPQEMELQYEE